MSEYPGNVMKTHGEFYELKEGSVKEPDINLGADIEMVQLPDGRRQWAMLSNTYVKNLVKVAENLLVEDGTGLSLKSTARSHFPSGYRAELDVTKELDKTMASRFMQLNGILRWAIELGRIDIYTEVSQLSQHQALPREGHLEVAYRIVVYYLQTGKECLVRSHQDLNAMDCFVCLMVYIRGIS